MKRRYFLTLSALAAGLAGLPAAQAQQNATRLLVGATPGGGTDIVARALALELCKRLGRHFIVDNRPGAAGNIAAQAVAKAAPDGNTLLLCYTSHAINASLYPSLPFDPVKDFTPLGRHRQPAGDPGGAAVVQGQRHAASSSRWPSREPGKLNIWRSPASAAPTTWPARCSSARRAWTS